MTDVLIIGDSCKDVFVYCTCNRLAPEFPAQVLDTKREISNGGMAMNVQANILSQNLSCDIITNNNWKDNTKTRYIHSDSNYMFVRVDNTKPTVPIDINLKGISWNDYSAVIISDYNKGFLSTQDIKRISRSHPCTFLDTKKRLDTWAEDITFIKINNQEYLNNKDILDHNSTLLDKVIRTMGPEGVMYRNRHYTVDVVEVKDVSGAGDSFLAGLVARYVRTQDIDSSIEYANECAQAVVQKPGVSTI